jgi:hypothetical protein
MLTRSSDEISGGSADATSVAARCGGAETERGGADGRAPGGDEGGGGVDGIGGRGGGGGVEPVRAANDGDGARAAPLAINPCGDDGIGARGGGGEDGEIALYDGAGGRPGDCWLELGYEGDDCCDGRGGPPTPCGDDGSARGAAGTFDELRRSGDEVSEAPDGADGAAGIARIDPLGGRFARTRSASALLTGSTTWVGSSESSPMSTWISSELGTDDTASGSESSTKSWSVLVDR